MQQCSEKLQSLQDKKLQQSQKLMDGWAKTNEQVRITIEKSKDEMEDSGQKNSSGIAGRSGIGHGDQRLVSRRRKMM